MGQITPEFGGSVGWGWRLLTWGRAGDQSRLRAEDSGVKLHQFHVHDQCSYIYVDFDSQAPRATPTFCGIDYDG
jgi:hypothetical protein